MLLNASKLKAEQALALGIVDALEDDYPSLIRRAVSRVRELQENVVPVREAPVSLELEDRAAEREGPPLSAEVSEIIRGAVREAAAADSWVNALETGYQAFAASACTAAAAEGIRAFQQRRKPDFSKTG